MKISYLFRLAIPLVIAFCIGFALGCVNDYLDWETNESNSFAALYLQSTHCELLIEAHSKLSAGNCENA